MTAAPRTSALPAVASDGIAESCGCDEVGTRERPEVFNRSGLSAIAYRIGDHGQFRARLLDALSASSFALVSPERSELSSGLRTRDPSDFSVALVDAFACAADVLTFYQERIANESYLRTATERVSLQELGKLVDYRLRPGVAAETWLAVALEVPPTPPPALGSEPGSFISGVPERLALEPGLRVQSLPGAGENPQVFETVEPLAEARPAWNGLRPWLSEARRPQPGDTFTYLAGVSTNLRPGDALLFVRAASCGKPSASNAWDFRLLDDVEPQQEAGRTRVSWRGGLQSTPVPGDGPESPCVYVLRRRVALFGPTLVTPPSDDAATSTDGVLPEIALDAIYPDITSGSLVVLAQGALGDVPRTPERGALVELYTVLSVTQVPCTEQVPGTDSELVRKVTGLELEGKKLKFDPNRTSVFAVSERLEYGEYPVEDDVTGARIPVAGSPEGLEAGRRLIVRGMSPAGAPVVVQAQLVAAPEPTPAGALFTISPPLPVALKRASVIVHANVVLASHGESFSEVLGGGDATQRFQRFELHQVPLTYRAAANELGAASELTLRVGNVAWRERLGWQGIAATDTVYQLHHDEQGRLFAQFGDGERGARLPTGLNNVRATYRKGLGVAGNVAAEKLSLLITHPLGVKGVSNPLPAEGGTDPEAVDAARRSLPLTTRTLGRAVSVLDYEDFARAFSGIAKARASVLQLPRGPTVVITIAGPGGAPLTAASPVWQHLLEALGKNGDPLAPVQLLSADLVTFRLGVRVKRDPAVAKAAVFTALDARLRAHFAFERRELGQAVARSEVMAVAQGTPGVLAVDITTFRRGNEDDAPVRLRASPLRVVDGGAQPAEILTLDPARLDPLELP